MQMHRVQTHRVHTALAIGYNNSTSANRDSQTGWWVKVIMNNGLITDTVLYWAEQVVSGQSSAGFILVMYFLCRP
jgi:hypothetical protein